MFLKLSYLTLYLRLTPNAIYRQVLYASMALVSTFGVAVSLVSMLLCVPYEKVWHKNLPGHCIDITSFYLFATITNVVLDLLIFTLPLPILWALNCKQNVR